MKNPWAFGIIVLLIVGYLAWNNFELPLLGKTEKIKGSIYDIDNQKTRGIAHVQGISYFYFTNNRWYEANYISNFRHQNQSIGNSISLQVLKSNPEKVKVLGFYKQKKSKNKKSRFFANYNGKHYELEIDNQIYKETEFHSNKGISKLSIGKVNQIKENSIILTPIKQINYTGENKMESQLLKKMVTYTVRIETKEKPKRDNEKIYQRIN